MSKFETTNQLPEGVVERFTKGEVAVSTIGKPYNARLLFSTPNRAEELYPGTAEQRAGLLTLLATEAARNDISRIGVLRVDRFNASLTSLDALPTDEVEQLSDTTTLLRGDQEAFFHDGLILHPGDGALIVTGDCHTIVAWSDNPDEPVVATHAGRNSLHRVLGNEHTGDVDSVVESVIQQYSDPTDVQIRLVAGIGPDSFDHPLDHPNPEYAENNVKLIKYFARFGGVDPNDLQGRIDIATTITSQARALGVPAEQISHDRLDTSNDERIWSNRTDGKPRNGIFVAHHG